MAEWAVWEKKLPFLAAWAVLLALGVNHLMDRVRVWAAARQAASLRRGKQV